MKISHYAHSSLTFTDSLNKQANKNFKAQSVNQVVDQVSFSEALLRATPEDCAVTTPDRVNPASDALLLNITDKLPASLAHMTWNGIKRWVTHGAQTPENLKAPLKPGHEKPVLVKELVDTLQAVMNQHPEYKPHIGQEHRWSPQSKSFRGWGYFKRLAGAIKGERPLPFPTMGRSKLICSLGLGATSVVMPTGKEEALESWVLGQEKGSVALHTLFGEAYKLNQGDLYATLLTAENVLSKGLYAPDRQDREVTSRLSYLRNDSQPNGDNFGAWYHLFGSALYSLMRPEWKAELAVKIESGGSLVLEGRDPQEDHINNIGVEIGKALKGVCRDGCDSNARLRPYLNRSEFGWGPENISVFTHHHSGALTART